MPRPTLQLISLGRSPRRDKKLVAVFSDRGRIRRTHFGAAGYGDFTVYWRRDPQMARAKRRQYIARHGAQEAWTDPTAASTLARHILWERPTVRDATARFRRRFGV